MKNEKRMLARGVLKRYHGDPDPVLSEDIHTIGKRAFLNGKIDSCTCRASGLEIETSAFAQSGVQRVRLPGDRCVIGDRAFENCEKLESVEFSGQGLKIGDSAFRGCKALTDVSFLEKAQSAGSYAFDSCTAITHAALGPDMETLEDGLFANCEGLRTVTFQRE